MSFRRIPFQFSSTDPVVRQAELEKRFGLPSRNNMYVDIADPIAMDASKRDLNQSSGSPRLQHRVPIFVEGYDKPVKSSVDSIGINSCVKRKPNVRVIPIDIEGDPQSSNRHRACSGPADLASKEEFVPPREDSLPLKHSVQGLTQPSKVKAATGPQVSPIHVEKSPSKPAKVSKSSSLKDQSKKNGCTTSKPSNKVKSEKTESETKQKAEPGIEVALRKIGKVLEELKPYESGVQEFVGTVKNKQYRYLDEMLTRCMLWLDDVETMGNDKVRFARKSAIKKVQACIDLLETKINAEYESADGSNDIQDNISLAKDDDMKEIGDSQITPECNGENAAEMAESNDNQCEVTAGTKISNEVTKLQMTELQEIVLDSQTEVEMEENKSSEESTITVATEEAETQMVTDVSKKNVNSAIPEVEMMESKPVETESLSATESLNESSKIHFSQNIACSNILEDKISATGLSDNPKSEENYCQSLDNSSITCDINVPEITNTIGAPNLSADQISTNL